MNPLEFLASSCAELRGLSDTLREAARGVVTDVSETMDVASSILTTIVSSSVGSDPNENVSKDVAEFEEMAQAKEREFKEKMESRREELSLHVNALGEKLEFLDETMKKSEVKHKELLVRTSNELDEVNARGLAAEQARNKDAEKVVEGEKKACYDKFEKYLSSRMGELAQSYTQQLKQAEDDIATVNIQLQATIHSKHEEVRLLQQELDEEAKRAAAEHERLSREYQAQRDESEDAMVKLGEAIDQGKEALVRGAADSEERLKELERMMRDENDVEVGKTRARIAEMEEEAKGFGAKIEELKFGIEKQKVDSDAEFADQVQRREQLMQKELDATKQVVEADRKETEAEYQKKYEKVSEQIENVKAERKKHQEEMGRILNADQGKDECEEREKVREHLENVEERKRELRRVQSELKQVQDDRDVALEKLRSGQKTQMGSALSGTEQTEKDREDQLNAVMRELDEQQRKLTFMQQLTVEKMDMIKAGEIARLKDEHEARKQQIINDVEEQIRLQIEKQMQVAEGLEDEDHQGHVRTIQDRLNSVTGRLDLLTAKLEGLERMSQEKFDELIRDSDEDLARYLREIAASDTRDSRGDELVNRLIRAEEDAQRRKRMVEREAEELEQQLDGMRQSFEEKMRQLEQAQSASKQHLLDAQQESEQRKNNLHEKISAQMSQMEDLSKQLSAREQEAIDFDQSFEDEKQKFAASTRQSFDEDLDHLRQQPTNIQSQISDLRNTVTAEMDRLRDQLDIAKAATQKITEYQLKARQDTIEETQLKYSLTAQEKLKIIQSDHDTRMTQLHEKRASRRTKHQLKTDALISTLDATFQHNHEAFESEYEDYLSSKCELQERNAALAHEIYDLEHNECRECVRKKDTIRRLLAKREQLKDRLSTLLSEVQVNEDQMYHIFGTRKPHLGSDIQKPTTATTSRRTTRPPSRAQTAFATPKVFAPRHAH